MFCFKCGNQLPEDAQFCPKCGTPQGQQPAPQQPQQPAPQQPQFQQPQYQFQQPQFQQPQQPVKQKKQKTQGGKKGKGIGIIIAAAVVVIIAVGGIFAYKKATGDIQSEYDQLCELTAHGTESYIYARMLTEKLLETDVTTADPNEVNKLFNDCLDSWDAVGSVAQKITDAAEKFGDKGKNIKPAKNGKFRVTFLPRVYADDATAVSSVQTVQQSVASCSIVGAQYRSDSSAAYSEVTQLRSVYNGRSTSSMSWQSSTQSVSSSFSTELFVSGEIRGTEFTTGNARSVHTLSRQAKSGTVSVSGVTALVNVSDRGSTIVAGSNDSGVVMDNSEIGGYLNTGSTISISTETDRGQNRVTFHEEGLSGWFILNKVGGYSLTRHEKDTPVSTPHVESTVVPIPERNSNEPPHTVDEILPDPPPPTSVVPGVDPFPPTIREPQQIDPPPQPDRPVNTGHTDPVPPPEDPPEDVHPQSGAITVRLFWGTHDDLDLHMDTPDGSHIYFGRKVAGGGELDVDMNASSSNLRNDCIENIFFAAPEAGHYKVTLKDFLDRTEGVATRYKVSVTIDGVETVYEGSIDSTSTNILICEFDYGGNHGNTRNNNPDPNETPTEVNPQSGEITVRLFWRTQDDLDLHMDTPDGSHISYNNKQAGGGVLDVDANSSGNMMENPIENIFFASPQSGHYKVTLKDYNDRTSNSSTHYVVRVQIGSQVQDYEGDIDGSGKEILICEFDYGGGSSGRIPGDASEWNGHRYKYYEQSMKWTEAKAFCESLGGHLATITSAEEQAYIKQVTSANAWIGGYEGSNHVWGWVTGEPMTYTNWNSGEPNDTNSNEWCMHIRGDGWNDLPNDDTSFHTGFICEWDGQPNIVNEHDLINVLGGTDAEIGDITISLAWSTEDDLDLHVFTPTGAEIYFDDRSKDGGELDVDMIPSRGDHPPCAENVYFAQPMNGEYYVYVYNYDDRTEHIASNYIVRIQIGDESKTFEGSIDGTDNYTEVCGFRYNGERRTGTGGFGNGSGGNTNSSSTAPTSGSYGASGTTADGGYARLSDMSWDGSSGNLNFVLEFSGLEDTAWIGIVPAGTAYEEEPADNVDVVFKWLSGVTSGQPDKLTYPLNDGNWEVRVYPSDHNDNTLPLCVVPFTVGGGDIDIDPPHIFDPGLGLEPIPQSNNSVSAQEIIYN